MNAQPYDVLRRVPPQNIEAEQSVLGAILIDNRQFELVAGILAIEDFYRESHREIFRAMEALAAAKKTIDAITLADVLRPQLEAIGGAGYIADLAAGVPAPSVARHYAEIVREKAIQRGLVTFGSELASRALEAPAPWNPDFTEELIAVAGYDLEAISSRMARKPEPQKVETLAMAIYKLEHGVEESVPTGLARVDRVFAGLNPGHVTMVAARTSKGKTALATNFAISAAKAGFPVAFFTLEMSAEEMWLRALACEAQINVFEARRRGFRDGQRERVAQAHATLGALPFEVLYRPSMRPRDLRLDCRRLAREMGAPLRLVIVDYLGLMRGDHRERERWREIQEVVFALKALAGELAVPIVLLCQLNRETNETVPPSLSNLRDTGATEEHASNVLFLWQKPAEQATAPVYDDWEPIELIIGKQRNGPAGMAVTLEFRKSWGAFIA